MKVTIENKKGLAKNIKIVVDKKTMDNYLRPLYAQLGGRKLKLVY